MKILFFKIKSPFGSLVSSISRPIRNFFRKIKIIAKGNSVALPYNSTLIKLARRPKNNPMGATIDTKSDN